MVGRRETTTFSFLPPLESSHLGHSLTKFPPPLSVSHCWSVVPHHEGTACIGEKGLGCFGGVGTRPFKSLFILVVSFTFSISLSLSFSKSSTKSPPPDEQTHESDSVYISRSVFHLSGVWAAQRAQFPWDRQAQLTSRLVK